MPRSPQRRLKMRMSEMREVRELMDFSSGEPRGRFGDTICSVYEIVMRTLSTPPGVDIILENAARAHGHATCCQFGSDLLFQKCGGGGGDGTEERAQVNSGEV